jgi:cysteine synthase B
VRRQSNGAHCIGTALEILQELGEVAAYVAGLGTGGTPMGNGRRLNEVDSTTRVIAAEPFPGDCVQGLRSLDGGFIPPIIDLSILDRTIFVSNHGAVERTQKLLAVEGLFAGVSGGAIAAIAVRVARELDEDHVVFVVPGGGRKYMSTGFYTRSIAELEADGTLATGSFW